MTKKEIIAQEATGYKTCTSCDKVKDLSAFTFRKPRGYHNSQCKPCTANWPSNIMRNDIYTYVYYLPEEHYVGIAQDPRHRMIAHNSNGKITAGYEILARFERRIDAHWFETLFHQRGYYGFQEVYNKQIKDAKA